MYFDFVEIGTSDFDTLLEKAGEKDRGMSIEPLSYYLDRLPNNQIIKGNFAVSDYDGELDVYWINPLNIQKYGLPTWVRGCNSVNKPHPTVMKILGEIGRIDLVERTQCKVLSWDTLIESYEIEKIGLLKIDTEGHDHIILNALISSKYSVYPDTIVFENNELTSTDDSDRVLARLLEASYQITNSSGPNITMKLIK